MNSLSIFTLSLLLLSQTVFAFGDNQIKQTPQFIPNALLIKITPKGLSFVNKNLVDFIQNITKINLSADKFGPHDVTLPYVQYSDYAALTQLKNYVQKWGTGLNILGHELDLKIGEIKFKTKLSKLEFIPLNNPLEFNNEFIFKTSIVFENFQLNINKLDIQDLANLSIAPDFYLDNINLQLQKKKTLSVDLKINLIISVSIEPITNKPVVKVLNLDQNLNDAQIDFSIGKFETSQHEIILKKTSRDGKVYTQTIKPNLAEIKNLLGFEKGQNQYGLENFSALFFDRINTDLPKLVNEVLSNLGTKFTTINHTLPLLDIQDTVFGQESIVNIGKTLLFDSPMKMSHQISNLSFQGGLNIIMQSAIENSNFDQLPIDKSSFMSKPPVLDNNFYKSDSVIVVNQALIESYLQNMLQLGQFSNLNYKQCNFNKNFNLSLTQVPKILKTQIPQGITADNKTIYLLTDVKLLFTAPYLSGVVLKDNKFNIKAKVILKISVSKFNNEEKLSFSIQEIMADTVDITDSNFNWLGKVLNGVNIIEKIKNLVVQYLNAPKSNCSEKLNIAEIQPYPIELFDFKFSIASMNYDVNKSFVFYIQFN